MRHLNALGVTSVFDAAASEAALAAWAALRDAGKLTLRTSAAMVVAPEEMRDPAAAVARLAALQQRHAGGLLRVRTAKFFADGVMEFPAQTAALLDPYWENGKPGASRGALYFDPAAFTRSVVALDAAGFAVHVHAIGDAAVRAALDAFAGALEANGGALHARGAVTHLELVDPADLPRFAALGVTASFSPQWALSDAYTREALEPFLGPEREARLYPIRSLAAAGAPLAFGSDWPVDPSDRFDAIETALTRRRSEPGGRPEPLGAHEAVDLDTALAAYTRGAARQLELDAEVGTLAPGRLADLIVLDRNLLATPPDAIGDTVVLATFLGGRLVYEADPSGL
jgi:hypothetical protein